MALRSALTLRFRGQAALLRGCLSHPLQQQGQHDRWACSGHEGAGVRHASTSVSLQEVEDEGCVDSDKPENVVSSMHGPRHGPLASPHVSAAPLAASAMAATVLQAQPLKRRAPKQLVEAELAMVHSEIRRSFDSQHKTLQGSACYYFDQAGKNVRPIVLLLMSKACSYVLPTSHEGYGAATAKQRTLAQIAEMIHTSSLVHDDVIDGAETRRQKASANVKYGDKQAIYAGDFILAKASLALAQLKDTRAVGIMATIIDDLVNGEFMQLNAEPNAKILFQHYLDKTYNKTASLLARGCEAVAAVVNHTDDICQLAYQYGKNLGMAFQLIDDYLDFVSTAEQMGKPTLADMKLGLATAPTLYAAEECPELTKLVLRRFKGHGDVETATRLVYNSQGLPRTKALAQHYANGAVALVMQLPESPERDGLVQMAHDVLSRTR